MKIVKHGVLLYRRTRQPCATPLRWSSTPHTRVDLLDKTIIRQLSSPRNLHDWPREIAEAKEQADELYRIRRSLDISTEGYQRLLTKEEIFDAATRKFRERTGITDQDLARIQRELELRYSRFLPLNRAGVERAVESCI